MTPESIIKLITDEQASLNKRKQTALARGLWTKANDCEVSVNTLQSLKQVIVLKVEVPSVT